jgi:hypothetical protein
MTTEIHPTQTKQQESMLGMHERDFYIDCLRSVMIALVILGHTALTYGASGLWFYHELPPSATLSSMILTLFCVTNQAYLMGFLFLLAGYFTPGSLERKGYARFLNDRFLRLGLPLLAFSLFLGPLTVAMVTSGRRQGILVQLRLALEPQGIQQWAAVVCPGPPDVQSRLQRLARMVQRPAYPHPTCTSTRPQLWLVAPERVWRRRGCAGHPAGCAHRRQRDWTTAWILR